MTMTRITPIDQTHIESFHAAVDSVARERKYLSFLEAPPLHATRAYLTTQIARGTVHRVAVDGDTVVGWCDIVPKERPTLSHTGVLGMGVIVAYRGRGIGRALIRAALDAALERRLARIELTVRTDNARAKRLYEEHGFEVEGMCRRHFFVDGEYIDSYLMAVLPAL
jgi:RimJ/RimL family protein N-acetyltransferase